jgi:hypothetical protein
MWMSVNLSVVGSVDWSAQAGYKSLTHTVVFASSILVPHMKIINNKIIE